MIHLFLGPMYAGKTTLLMSLYDKQGGIILDFSERKCQEGHMMNHDKISVPCIHLPCLQDIHTAETSLQKKFSQSPFIYINEAQFFPDLLDFVKRWEEKNIYIFGLDGDFQRNPMGQILQIIPLCDKVEKLNGNCSKCKSASIFSKRITQDTQQILLDETAYIPLCRNCYLYI
jgi:thymidine kinase